MSPISTFLYATPSFLEGAARAIDFSGTLNEFNRSETGEQADSFALYADWRLIGEDIQRAMLQVGAEIVKDKPLVQKAR